MNGGSISIITIRTRRRLQRDQLRLEAVLGLQRGQAPHPGRRDRQAVGVRQEVINYGDGTDIAKALSVPSPRNPTHAWMSQVQRHSPR
jgi:hypothetical protein